MNQAACVSWGAQNTSVSTGRGVSWGGALASVTPIHRAREQGVASPVASSEGAARRARFESIAKEHERALFTRALRLCGDRDAALDLVQDTFERAFRRLDDGFDEAHRRAWLMTVLTNLFLDGVKRRRVAVVSLAEHDVPCEAPPREPSGDEIGAAVAALPDDLREVVDLHGLRGMRYREIATRLGLPLGTVGTRLARARGRLKEALVALTEES
ncbi:MAG: RNA polymerase sigma factor [Polyangiaceae bacterium]|jgi:RNA polymerase sigma-70 factor (ECF subfamily)|nr:RNA polymerase sigma factor [Polyangiaceae bacterium]